MNVLRKSVHAEALRMEPAFSPGAFLWVLWLSMWGATAAYLQKIKDTGPHSFNFFTFLVECFTAGFVGLLTYFVCDYYMVDARLAAVWIGVNAYTGTRCLIVIRKRILTGLV